MYLKYFYNYFSKTIEKSNHFQTRTKKQQKINKILLLHPIFLKNWKKMLPNSGLCPKNVAKNPDFYVVKKPKKLKSC